MKVTVVFLGRASDISGVNVLEVELPEQARLKDLIRAIGEKVNPELAKRYFQGHYIFVIHINGIAIDNPEYKLHNGDRVTLITPEMGG